MLASATVNIWGVKPEYPLSITAKRPMLDAIINKPSLLAVLNDGWQERQSRYLVSFGAMFKPSACSLHRTWDVDILGYESIDYKAIIQSAKRVNQRAATPHEYHIYPNIAQISADRVAEDVCLLASLLNSTKYKPQVQSPFSIRHIETLKLLIILTTFLVECHNFWATTQIIKDVFADTSAKGTDTGLSDTIDPHNISVWYLVGQIAGFQKAAMSVMNFRLQKWGAPQTPSADTWDLSGATKRLLRWINANLLEDSFSFSIGRGTGDNTLSDPRWSDVTRALPAMQYALIEYLINFGFPIRPPKIELDRQGLRARVERKVCDEPFYTPTPQELEYARYLKSQNLAWGKPFSSFGSEQAEDSMEEGDSGAEGNSAEEEDGTEAEQALEAWDLDILTVSRPRA